MTCGILNQTDEYPFNKTCQIPPNVLRLDCRKIINMDFWKLTFSQTGGKTNVMLGMLQCRIMRFVSYMSA